MNLTNIPAIAVSDLSKHVVVNDKKISILKNIQLHIEQKETVAIVGRSGSGKTTLLSILAGLDHPSTGTVSILGRDITKNTENELAAIRRDLIGFVFQSFQLIPELNVLENVILPLEIKGLNRETSVAKAHHWLNNVGLSHRIEHFPKTLSGGEQQRVALARAFVSEPRILFADEPTGSLDMENGQIIIDLLFKLNKELGSSLIIVTHDMSLAQKCKKTFKLNGGKIEH